ncbi:MAG TPA: dihydrofolate reductase [Chitinophagaceae bacterium]|nr:dihydrofolate reductase [Chitinophagaceae bacterium]
MIITLVVAAARNNAIGKDNKLLWHLPNDMRYFKNVTWGFPVVMGRKTFEALGKPLTGRKNIVLTRQPDWKADGTVAVKSFDDALLLANEMDVKELMVIGGGEIYSALFDKARRIHMTRVNADLDGDTFFPEIDPKKWGLVSQKNYEADAKHAYNYSFQVWER